jgi:hypothetical protein
MVGGMEGWRGRILKLGCSSLPSPISSESDSGTYDVVRACACAYLHLHLHRLHTLPLELG